MGIIRQAIDIFLHLDRHLTDVTQDYGIWTYAILFCIIFMETGFVVTPFLPGDSLLFAAGALASLGTLNPLALFLLLAAAAILGDTANYWIGKYLGPQLTRGNSPRLIKKEHLDRTHAFFEKYGGKTIILARFVPIIRTFAPFVAGIGTMTYSKFIAYNIIGGVAWVALCTSAGYFFGNLPLVKKNFSVVILAIIFVSILPGIIEYIKHRRSVAATRATDQEPTQH
jgi:membrane-associated protein